MLDGKLLTVKKGLSFFVKQRRFGYQYRGVSPQGAQDQTAFCVAFYMLGKPKHYECLEMIYPGDIKFKQDCLFVLAGAFYEQVNKISKEDESSQHIDHLCVYQASSGDSLCFNNKLMGFRTLMMAIPFSEKHQHREGLSLEDSEYHFPYLSEFYEPIRVIKGPEFGILKDDDLFQSEWQIDQQSDLMGLRLLGESLAHERKQLVSQPVTDGTIQLSPNGPIILIRHRQTTGGYPRIANVIQADMDRLAQLPYNSRLSFKPVSFDEASALYYDAESRLAKIEKRFNEE